MGMFTTSCDDNTTTLDDDMRTLEDYFKDNNIDAILHPNNIYYTIEQEGTGAFPSPSSTVIIRYEGRLLDGFVFDKTEGEKTIKAPIGGFIFGFQVALTTLQKGGKGTFYLPSALGYGSVSTGDIPANSILVFDIEMVDFVN